MKYPLAIFTAATAAWALVRSLAGESSPQPPVNPDAASEFPRLTPMAVERLAYTGATNADIADRFLVEETFIAREYQDLLRSIRANRRIMLRGLQAEAAKKLNASMLTWLGKNELGQSASPDKEDDDESFPGIVKTVHAD